MTEKLSWWKKTTIYQIYPRSFFDTNEDGIGDLQGIIKKLDYIKDLGFETIWISPFYQSPQQDFGYDISDYLTIDQDYGTMADVDELIEEIHKREMRVLFDLVLNHTSIQHEWFRESRSSRNNPRRDWYIWRDGRGKHPPNNWKAIPGGSAWHYDENTNQYYYASFLPFQPDLNWRNPEVKQAMFDVVRFWLEKGVDGFRLDIFHSIYKDELFRNNPFSFRFIPTNYQAGFFQQWEYSINQPEVFDLAVKLRQVVDSYEGSRMLIGEVFGDVETEKKFLGEVQEGLNLIFLWQLLKFKPKASFFRDVISHYEYHFPYPSIPIYVFGNHDRRRLLSCINNDQEIAKLLTLLQFTVRGVPVTYYGEEVGMTDGDFPASRALDPIGRKYQAIPKFVLDLLGVYVNRDGCRTPMQWEDTPNAGFCEKHVKPWLPVNENYSNKNVADQDQDDQSLLNTYRNVIRLRNNEGLLQFGRLNLLTGPDVDKDLLVYERRYQEEAVLVVLNFSKREKIFVNTTECLMPLMAVGMDIPHNLKKIRMDPYSGIILKKSN